MVHGDLSGNNVLIDDEGNARLADLGRAKVIGEDGYHTDLVAGSVEYMAPELFEEPEHQEEQDEKNAHYVGPPFSMMSDIYAFSMLAFQVFFFYATENIGRAKTVCRCSQAKLPSTR